ncbi:MAG: hypothetical protein RIC55_31005 [Pirellulaceae bacterium]
MAKHARVTTNDVHAVYPASKRVTVTQLNALQREFGAELPRGYRAFLNRFGHGWINDWLQIYCPDAALLNEQRESLVRDFLQYTDDYTSFDSAKLSEADMRSCIQIGIDQDVMRLFACPRFVGSVFAWSGLAITRHKAGVEVLDPFAGMRMDKFAYFFPLEPVPEYRSLACQSKTLDVQAVVQAVEDRCRGPVHVIDVDEGPGLGTRTPAFWLFPEKLGVKLHVYAVETDRGRRVYLTFGTSQKLLSKVDTLIGAVSRKLGVKFKPARWH